MDKRTRTENALRNTKITLLCQGAYLLVSFVCRTIFTRLLGAEYLGISGLFTNILTVLSFAEMGMGSALVYRLYEPLAKDDKSRIVTYLELYKKVYCIIILVILFFGILLIPFLDYLVEAPSVSEDIRLLYIFYLMDAVTSYVYVYKKSLLTADQKDYIVSIFTQIFNIVMNISQIIMLLFTKNYILYCTIKILCNLLNNIVCSAYVDKKYSYIKQVPAENMNKEEFHSLFIDVKGLLMTKIASIAFSGTDNLFISAFIGIKYVGILSNYTLIITTFNGVLNKIFSSITASVGNLAVDSEKEKIEKVLGRMFFLNTAIYGYICLGMGLLLREFVTQIWFTTEYDLPQIVVLIVIFEFFFRGIHYPVYAVRNALGYFSQYKKWFVAMAILNILLDFMLVRPLGIAGLYIATILCRGITYILDVKVVYNLKLEKSAWYYWRKVLIWMLFVGSCGVTMLFMIQVISFSGIVGFLLRIFSITAIYVIMFLIFFYKTEDFVYYRQLLKRRFR